MRMADVTESWCQANFIPTSAILQRTVDDRYASGPTVARTTRPSGRRRGSCEAARFLVTARDEVTLVAMIDTVNLHALASISELITSMKCWHWLRSISS